MTARDPAIAQPVEEWVIYSARTIIEYAHDGGAWMHMDPHPRLVRRFRGTLSESIAEVAKLNRARTDCERHYGQVLSWAWGNRATA